MKKYTLILAVFVVVFVVNDYSQINVDDDDVQIWNETAVYFPLIKIKDKNGKEATKLSGYLLGTVRFGRNIRHFIDERIGFGFDYKINKNFSFSPSYYYIAAQPDENRKEFESRIRLDLTAEKKWSKFTLKDRNRVEQRFRNSKSDITRYRNRLQVIVPISNSKKEELFSPFIGDEVFYDFSQDKWIRNELTVGINKKFNKNTAAEFFYTLRHNSSPSTLRTVNVFGVNLKFTVD
jgi:hypothetical protein